MLVNVVKGQDTIRYEGLLNDILLYETIELYPNNTFKWTSEYDLSWSEYGDYKIREKMLILNYNSAKRDVFLIKEDELYRYKGKRRITKRKKDRSLKTKWSWLFGHKYKIIKYN